MKLSALLKIKFWARNNYLRYYRKLKINNKLIYIESQHGENLNGNMFYILKELCRNPKYKEYKKVLGVSKKGEKNAMNLLKQYQLINSIKLVQIEHIEYYKILSSAKYIFTDTSIYGFFIKKEGQIIVNTWHGTPLKTLGRHVKNDFCRIGNLQKNFIISDFLLYPNYYTKNKMLDSFYLNDIGSSKIIINGYPRNEVFFNKKMKECIMDEYHLHNFQTFAYMPTWRGTVGKVSKIREGEFYKELFDDLDSYLKDNQLLFVNFHPYLKKIIDLKHYKHIRYFPKKYETYDFLNAIDVLITDYSSVMFDYANTNRKIILYCYDEKEYKQKRGLYINLEEFPFPICHSVCDLVKEMNDENKKNYNDFLKTYCQFDSQNSSRELCEMVICNKSFDRMLSIPSNRKDNILIYGGNFKNDKINKSLTKFLNSIDTENYNIYLTFELKHVVKKTDIIKNLPDNIRYFSILDYMNVTIFDRFLFKLYRNNKIKINICEKRFKYLMQNDIKRMYGNSKFNYVIHYGVCDYKKLLTFCFFELPTTVFVHAGIEKQCKQSLEYACKKYNYIVTANKNLIAQNNAYLCTDFDSYLKLIEGNER